MLVHRLFPPGCCAVDAALNGPHVGLAPIATTYGAHAVINAFIVIERKDGSWLAHCPSMPVFTASSATLKSLLDVLGDRIDNILDGELVARVAENVRASENQ
jgi:hypothetical protein